MCPPSIIRPYSGNQTKKISIFYSLSLALLNVSMTSGTFHQIMTHKLGDKYTNHLTQYPNRNGCRTWAKNAIVLRPCWVISIDASEPVTMKLVSNFLNMILKSWQRKMISKIITQQTPNCYENRARFPLTVFPPQHCYILFDFINTFEL